MKMRIFLIPLSLIGAPTAAQNWTYNPAASQAIMADVQHQALITSMKSSQSNDTQAKQENSISDALVYSPSKSRTRANLAALGRRLAASDPANATLADELFASTDVIGAVNDVIDQFGLERNNVAHAYALYWVVYWGLANKVQDTPSAKAIQAVAEQSERGFANNAEFVKMDNVQKQAAAEELMALTAIMDATSEQAKSDPVLAEQLAKGALEGSRKSGLGLDEMTLTEDGFVPAKRRKKADASDATPGDEQALAFNNNGAGKSETTNYLLIAAAAGAGLGGVFLLGKVMGRKA